MSFSIEHQYHPKDDSLIFHIGGEFKGVNVFDFEKALLTEIRTKKAKKVVFDLSQASYLDSAAIEFLFHCARICKETGQTLRLSRPKESIRKLFSILRVDSVIEID